MDIAKDLKPSLVYYDENDKQETVQDCKIVLDGYDEEGGWSCEDDQNNRRFYMDQAGCQDKR